MGAIVVWGYGASCRRPSGSLQVGKIQIAILALSRLLHDACSYLSLLLLQQGSLIRQSCLCLPLLLGLQSRKGGSKSAGTRMINTRHRSCRASPDWFELGNEDSLEHHDPALVGCPKAAWRSLASEQKNRSPISCSHSHNCATSLQTHRQRGQSLRPCWASPLS